jgi:hypothetical protein
MSGITIALLILALFCFLLSAANVMSPRINFQGLGLSFLTLSMLIK